MSNNDAPTFKKPLPYYNFETERLDVVDIATLDDDRILEFIPRLMDRQYGEGPLRGLYRVYREMGDGKMQAFAKALEQFVSKNGGGA